MFYNEVEGREAFLPKLLGMSGLLYILLTISSLSPTGQGLYWIALTFAFGIIVLSSWLMGWKVVVYALPGITLYLVPYLNGTTTTCNLTLTTALTAITAPFALHTMKWAGIGLEPGQTGAARIWKALLLAGIKASTFSYLLISALPLMGVQLVNVYEYSLGFLIGAQAAGLFALLFAMTITMRFLSPRGSS